MGTHRKKNMMDVHAALGIRQKSLIPSRLRSKISVEAVLTTLSGSLFHGSPNTTENANLGRVNQDSFEIRTTGIWIGRCFENPFAVEIDSPV